MSPEFTRRRTLELLGLTSAAGIGFLRSSLGSAGGGSTSGTGSERDRASSTWTQRAKLVADEGDGVQSFGRSIALDGTTALVGSSGIAYAYTETDNGWENQAKLTADDQDDGDFFGQTVALDGDTALVGARHDDDPNGNHAGSAYVFTPADGEWTQQAKLAAADGETRDRFGQSVALDGDTALVGADQGDKPGGQTVGRAYVFTRADGEWTQQARLAAEGGDSEFFGWAVALDGDTAVISARMTGPGRGEAYVFTRADGGWTQETRLTASDGDPEDQFGWSVALRGDTAVVSAQGNEDQNGEGSGSAYVFTRTADGWNQEAILAAADGGEHDNFGSSVAFDGDTILVGANTDDEPNGENGGSAYVFTREGERWVQQTKLAADDGDERDNFGEAAALDDDTAFVGAYADEDPLGYFAGSAYVYWKDQTEVTLDIEPGSDRNPVDLAGEGTIPVAIVRTDSFDPTTGVDVGSLRFGAPDIVDDGEGATPVHDGHLEDVTGDGTDDLLLHFPTEDAGFERDDEAGELVGETDEGEVIFGMDRVETAGGAGEECNV